MTLIKGLCHRVSFQAYNFLVYCVLRVEKMTNSFGISILKSIPILLGPNTITMLKNILAIVAGIIVGGTAVALLEMWIGPLIFEYPESMIPDDPQSLATYLEEIPTGAKVIVVLAQFVGAWAASEVAGRISGGIRKTALLTGGIMVFFTIMNLFTIPHPAWMTVSMPLMAVIGVYFGAKDTD